MHSSHRLTIHRAILTITILILIQSDTADGHVHGQSLLAGNELKEFKKRESSEDKQENGQNVYGLGVRMGSYLQAFAYLLGFMTLESIDAKGQFSGIILAFQLLIRWTFRFHTDKMAIPELWVGLAQLLLFTTPGAFLLFLSFSTTRRHWKTTDGRGLLRHEVIRGEGLNFLQVFAVLAWVNALHILFAIKIQQHSALDNPIWMMKTWKSDSTAIKLFMITHAIVIAALEVIPYMFYLCACYTYVENVCRQLRGLRDDERTQRRYNRIETDEDNSRKRRNCINRALVMLLPIVAIVLVGYVVILIISVELTIRDAKLHPQSDILHDPGQLLPLLTGGLSLISALVNIANGKQNLLMSKTPVRHSRTPSDNFDGILQRSKDGDDDGEQLLKKVRPSVHRQRTFRQQHLSGWRVGAIGAAVAAAVVLVLNISATLWVTFSPFPKKDGIGTLLEGSCADVKQSSRWIHLVINILSTVLLSCSNYCMQVLASPTRDEIVKAHNRRFWLHIGVPNLRNLLYIAKDRRNLFLLLAVSSVPLHLLFNSVVFANIQANEYQVIPATPDFLNGGTYKTTALVPDHIWTRNSTDDVVAVDIANYTRSLVANATELRDKIQRREIQYENMTAEWCIKNYAQQFISKYGHVLVVQDEIDFHGLTAGNATFDSFDCAIDGIRQQGDASLTSCRTSIPFHSAPNVFPAWDWQCPPPWQDNCTQVDYDVLESQPQWAPYGSPARYCLAEVVKEHCRLQFSFAIAAAVIVCNIIKTVCMGYIVWKYRQTFLATIGDAIASFLDDPDPETKDRCLYSRQVFKKEWEWMRHNDLRDPKAVAVEPERYSSRRPFWGLAVSKTRWFATYFMYSVALIIGAVSIKRTLAGMPTDIRALWHTGFGDLLGNNLISGSVGNSVLGSVLLANLPQALLSYLYLVFNALYTCMLLTREWTQYLAHRKPLRVTCPAGRQRSTYWLHLPYRYSAPLLVASGLLHWLASQSLFLVQVTVLAEADRDPAAARQISTCGYSPVAIILTVAVGSLIMLGGLALALRRYPAGMPLASSCSATISAACHPPEDDVDASVLPVQWGVVREPAGWGPGEVGHCSFSSFEVKAMVRGRLYA
ncbi:uncharacterized protein BKCO1_110001 [Diplodia corticola]|uniref:DUF6536 domain-containing protein n=1 Tax=Diplodia corticola TaxID=236234 RepID=A0A1J9R7G3_9PEZI|nr:uncharacterized protein BKCO1_110001 [Diplodia corticola]OJD36457.1 hypothetical protein BKCO1_110001 [Diplodia corticola]